MYLKTFVLAAIGDKYSNDGKLDINCDLHTHNYWHSDLTGTKLASQLCSMSTFAVINIENFLCQ